MPLDYQEDLLNNEDNNEIEDEDDNAENRALEKSDSNKIILTYTKSREIERVEKGIAKTLVLSIKAVCEGYYNIKLNKLYKNIKNENGEQKFKDFTEYLRAERVPVPYSTAIYYAQIGEGLMKHKAKIKAKQIEFNEKNSIHKMRYVTEALGYNSNNAEEIFEDLKDLPLRKFEKKYITNNRLPKLSKSPKKGSQVKRLTYKDGTKAELKIVDNSVLLSESKDGDEDEGEILDLFYFENSQTRQKIFNFIFKLLKEENKNNF